MIISLEFDPKAYKLFYSADNILKDKKRVYLDLIVRSDRIEFIGYDAISGILTTYISLPAVKEGGKYEAHIDPYVLGRGLEAFVIFGIKKVHGVIDTEKDTLTLTGERVVKGKRRGKLTYIIKLNHGRYYNIDLKEFEKLDFPTFIALDVKYLRDRIEVHHAAIIYDKIYIISKIPYGGYELVDTIDIPYYGELKEPAVCLLAFFKHVISNIPVDAEARLYYGNGRVIKVSVNYHGLMNIYILEHEKREKILNEFFKLIKKEEKEEKEEKEVKEKPVEVEIGKLPEEVEKAIKEFESLPDIKEKFNEIRQRFYKIKQDFKERKERLTVSELEEMVKTLDEILTELTTGGFVREYREIAEKLTSIIKVLDDFLNKISEWSREQLELARKKGMSTEEWLKIRDKVIGKVKETYEKAKKMLESPPVSKDDIDNLVREVSDLIAEIGSEIHKRKISKKKAKETLEEKEYEELTKELRMYNPPYTYPPIELREKAMKFLDKLLKEYGLDKYEYFSYYNRFLDLHRYFAGKDDLKTFLLESWIKGHDPREIIKEIKPEKPPEKPTKAEIEIVNEFKKIDDQCKDIRLHLLDRLTTIRKILDEYEEELEQKPDIKKLEEIEKWITKTLDELQSTSAKIVECKDMVIKTAERLKEKYPEHTDFIEDLKNAYIENRYAFNSKLRFVEGDKKKLYELLEKVRAMKKEVKEKAEVEEEKEEVKEEVEEEEEKEEAKEEERKELDAFKRTLANILAEKLTYYAKSELLKKRVKLDEVNEIVSNLKEYIESLAEKIALKEITQKQAESRLSRKIEELMRRKTEKIKPIIEALESKLTYYAETKLLERGIEPSEADRILDEMKAYIKELAEKVGLNEITQEEAERLINSKIEEIAKTGFRPILEKLIEVYKSHLEELGYPKDKVNEIVEAVKFDIETLAEDVVKGRMTLEEALERVKGIPPPVEKITPPPIERPTVEVARPEVREVEFERVEEPSRKIINLNYEEDVLDVLDREWACIVSKGLYDCLKEKGYIIIPQVSLSKLVTAFAKVARAVLHDRKPRYVREWFITRHCPMYNDIIRMIFTFGLNRKDFIEWFKGVYYIYKPKLEKRTGIKLPEFDEFYKDFKEFIINYKLLQ